MFSLSASFVKLSEEEIKATESKCKCQSWDTCGWSKDMVNSISSLPSNHPTKKDFESFFKEFKCIGKQQEVYCCDGEDMPTIEQRKILQPSKGTSIFRSSILNTRVKNFSKY